MATEIEKLTRYAKKFVKHEWHSYAGDSRMVEDAEGAWVSRDDVLAAVAAIEERHAREVEHLKKAAREWYDAWNKLRAQVADLEVKLRSANGVIDQREYQLRELGLRLDMRAEEAAVMDRQLKALKETKK